MIAKKWGNSLGVILPREMVKTESIREHQKLIIKIETKQLGCKLMGILKHWRKDPQKIKDEARRGWK